MANKYNYTIYKFIIEGKDFSTPPQDLIDLLETGWEILSATPYGFESRSIIFILRHLI